MPFSPNNPRQLPITSTKVDWENATFNLIADFKACPEGDDDDFYVNRKGRH